MEDTLDTFQIKEDEKVSTEVIKKEAVKLMLEMHLKVKRER